MNDKGRLWAFLCAIPVVGWILRDVVEGDRDNIWYFAVAVLTGLVLAIGQWGAAAVVMLALALVPVCLGMLVLISRG